MITSLNKSTLLAELNAPYSLTPEAIEFYRENGYVKLKNVLSPDVLAYYGDIITRQVIALNTLVKPMEERTTYEKAFLQIENLWRTDEDVEAFVFAKRLAQIAAELMGVNGVRLYHDQALYKESGGGITPWHADQFYWPLATDRTATVWIPLQPVSIEMGPLAFAEKSQTVAIGRDQEISDESEALLAQELANRDFTVNDSPFELGEVSYHAGWTFHRAGPNVSGEARKVMTMIYMDEQMRLAEPKNGYQTNDWHNWCSGYPIGEKANGPLNPVLFSQQDAIVN